MKKILAMLLVLAMVLSMVACGGSGSTTETTTEPSTEAQETEALETTEAGKIYEGVTLEMATQLNTSGESLAALQALIDAYKEETGCEITLTVYASADYESAMKTRMASGELPDIWETHGWSRLRYGEYLEPVNNESWYSDLDAAAIGTLQGDGDTAYALMLNAAITCVVWNLTDCQAAGVDPYSIYTWDDFMEAMQTLVDAGKVPVVNYAPHGNALGTMAGVFISYDDAYSADGQAQLDGTYDWESMRTMLQMWADLIDMGALWEDRNTMNYDAAKERLIAGDSVVSLGCGGVAYVKALHEMDPSKEYIITPIPAASEDGNMYVQSGEGYAVGVWRDSANKEAAMGFLAYMAENGSDLATATGGSPCLSTITMDADNYAVSAALEVAEKFPDAVYVNMWDREWMPNGMWNILAEASGMLFADWSEAGQDAVIEFLRSSYQEKYTAAHG